MRIPCLVAAALGAVAASWWHQHRSDRALAGERLEQVLERAVHRRTRADLAAALVVAQAADVITRAQTREE